MTPEELTEIRLELDLSPTGMARAMGVTYCTYNNWQSGRRGIPPVAERLVLFFLITYYDLNDSQIISDFSEGINPADIIGYKITTL